MNIDDRGYCVPGKPLRWLLAVALVFVLQGAHAHDPGLSFAEMRMEDGRIVLKSSYSISDLQILGSLDIPGDSAVSLDDAFVAEFGTLVSTQTRVSLDGQSLSADSVSVYRSGTDGIGASLAYRVDKPGSIVFENRLLDRMAPGHRQFLEIQNGAEDPATFLLSPQQMTALVESGGSHQSLAPGFFAEGIRHIWIGIDHCLFLLALLLPIAHSRAAGHWSPAPGWRQPLAQVVATVSAFTLAHSLTLALAVSGLVNLPAALVESVIALTVMLAALNNVVPVLKGRLWVIAFVFGLIHGFGFASVLVDLGLPEDQRWLALLMFNLGVEAGQLALVLMVLPLIFALRRTRTYETLVLQAGSLVIVAVSTVWFAERTGVFSNGSWFPAG